MTSPLIQSLLAVLVISVISLVGIGGLVFGKNLLKRLVFFLVSVSVGALFGDAFLHLVPEALASNLDPVLIFSALLGGIFLFFLLEKFLHWRHDHDHEHGEEALRVGGMSHDPSRIAPIIFIGDAIHNFIDGVIVAASFIVSPEVGLATALAVIIHEIPQEIGDFAIMIHVGFTKWKALLFNFASSLFAFAGALVPFIFRGHDSLMPFLLAFAAGGFVYIAGSDLVPELHKTRDPAKSLLQFFAILVGAGIMFALLSVG